MSLVAVNAPATRDAWKTAPMPQAREQLAFDRVYAAEAFARIRAGLVPEAMEDKWFIFYEAPWLYFHRSWTGFAIFALRFEHDEAGMRVAEAWVNRDPDQYGGHDAEHDCRLLGFVIDALLLRRNVAFPLPTGIPASAPEGVYQHAFSGTAQREAPVRTPTRRSLWLRVRDWLRR